MGLDSKDLGPQQMLEAVHRLDNEFAILERSRAHRKMIHAAGDGEWRVLDEHEDLASAHFETTKLAGAPLTSTDEDLAAGRYELKLELFDTAGNLVNWTDQGVEPGITDQNNETSVTKAPVESRVSAT